MPSTTGKTQIPVQELVQRMEKWKGEPGISLELGDDKIQMSFKFETGIKELINNIAKRGQTYTRKIDGEEVTREFSYQFDEYPEELPTNDVGVIVYYLLRGVKQDFNASFEGTPYCLEERSTTSSRPRTKTLTKDAKNKIIARMNLSYYEKDIEDGVITLDEAFASIKKARDEKQSWVEKGWFLTPEATFAPYKVDSDDYAKYLERQAQKEIGKVQRGKELGAKRAQDVKEAKAAKENKD